jgi:hypothetical protein
MDSNLLNKLLNDASKWGAKGVEVVGWVPPQGPTQDSKGMLILKYPENTPGSVLPWHLSK